MRLNLRSFYPFLGVFLLIGIFVQSNAFAQATKTFTNSTNWNVPAGYNLVTIDCWGAGGAGSTRSLIIGRGPGGGGGAFSSSTVNITTGNIYAITIGAGGQASTLTVSGSNTSFEDIVIAEGGLGVLTNAGTAGTGGTVPGSTGTIVYAGGNGSLTSATNSGGGGGSAGWRGIGATGTTAVGGAGNGPNSGNGGAPVSVQVDGNPGNNYGGGGSGARTTGATEERSGGNGASGLVIVNPTLWANPITNVNPSAASPFTDGQLLDVNLTVSGIARGPGLTAIAAADQYTATNFVTGAFNITTARYFEFALTPSNGRKINLSAFRFSAVRNASGPTTVELRSSLDNYATAIDAPAVLVGSQISLSAATYQNLVKPVTFRLYGIGSTNTGAGTLGIFDYAFFGTSGIAPYISGFSPASVCNSGSAQVVISGLNFTGATSVRFNGSNAVGFTVNNATQITATVPVSATTGIIEVTTPDAIYESNTSLVVNSIPGQPSPFFIFDDVVCGGETGKAYSLEFIIIGDRTSAADPITMLPNPGSSAPANEEVFRAIDNNVNTKYLNFAGAGSGIQITPNFGSSVITGISLTSANDAPSRDPTTYLLRGSNDGISWTTISSGAVPAFTARFQQRVVSFGNSTTYTEYQLTFPTIVSGAIMQVAEIELLETTISIPGLSYNWSYSGTGATFSSTSSAVTVDFALNATPGNLSVTATNVCGTSPSRSLAITVNTQTPLVVTPTYCQPNGKVTLTASAASNYLWSNGAITQAIEIEQAGTYSVSTTNASSCTATSPFSLGNELVTNGSFSAGNTGFTTNYVYKVPGSGGNMSEGQYSITTSANIVHNSLYGRERNNGTGNIMAINGSVGAGATVWNQNNVAVQPNTTYYFSAWGLSIFNSDKAVLQFAINGNQVGTIAALPDGYTVNTGPYNWVRFFGSWESGANTMVNLSIVNLNTAPVGNDLALDDISFATLAPFALSATPNANGGSSPCQGNQLFLASNAIGGSSPFTYAWTGPGGFNSAQRNPIVTGSASVAQNGTYNLVVTDALGCTHNSSVVVAVSPRPANQTVTASSPAVCAGGSVNINLGSSEIDVFYRLRNTANSQDLGIIEYGTGGAISLNTGPLIATTTVEVLGTKIGSGCVAPMITTVTITVNPNPVLVTSNQSRCLGTVDLTDPAVTIGSSGGISFSYWQDVNASIAIVDPTTVTSGTYYIRSVSAQSCADVKPITVAISATPDPTFNYSAATYCSSSPNPSPTFNTSTPDITIPADVVAVLPVGSPVTVGQEVFRAIDNSNALKYRNNTGAGSGLIISPAANTKVVTAFTLTSANDAPTSDPTSYLLRGSNDGVVWVTIASGAVLPAFSARGQLRTLALPAAVSYVHYELTFPTINGGAFFQIAEIQLLESIQTSFSGVFSSTAGLVFANASSGAIDLTNSTPGAYVITNTITPSGGGCLPVSTTRNVTISALPVATFDYPTNDICQAVGAVSISPVYNSGGGPGVFSTSSAQLSLNTTTGAINVGASLPGNYAVVNTRSAVGACPIVRDTTLVTINPYTFDGSISSSALLNEVCSGTATSLISSGTSYLSALLQERFNGAFNTWVRANTSTSGTVANAVWTLRPNGFNADEVLNSNNASQFYLTSSIAQNGSTTNTTLRSPQLSTQGYANLSLNFYHYFRYRGGITSEAAFVEVSTNGITWTAVQTYNSTQGANNAFAQVTVNLNSYVGFPVFFVRFRYATVGLGWYWAVDNVTLSGTTNNYNYAWTSDPSGFASNLQNPNISPTTTASYIVTATNTYGCSSPTSPVPVVVKPVPLITNAAPSPICSGTLFAITPESNEPGATITWTRPAVAGISNAAVVAQQNGAPSETLVNTTGAAVPVNYIFQASLDGCSTNQPIAVSVNPKPVVTIAASTTVCNGVGASLSPVITNSVGALSYLWTPAATLSNAAIASPVANPTTASQVYELVATDGNGCESNATPTTVINYGFAGTPGLWSGANSTAWNNCLNWNDGAVPTVTTDVSLLPGAPNICEITGSRLCKSLALSSSSTINSVALAIKAGGSLIVTENVVLAKTNLGSSASITLEGNGILECNNLSLAGSAESRRDAILKISAATSILRVNGNLNVSSGGFLDVSNTSNVPQSATLLLKGNLTSNAVAADFNIGSATFNFEGTVRQDVTFPTGLQLHRLRLNNPANPAMRFISAVNVANQLNLVLGRVDLNGRTLTLGTNSTPCQITNSGSNAYLIGWNTGVNGTVVHQVPQSLFSYYFPVGDNTNFTPFEVSLNSATLSPGATLSSQLFRNKHPELTTPTAFMSRYWSMNAVGIASPTYDVEYSYAPGDLTGVAATILPVRYENFNWIGCIQGTFPANEGSGLHNTVARTFNWSGLNGFSDFTASSGFTVSGLNTWSGVGTWNTSGNWSLSIVPTSTEVVRIGSGTVSIDAIDITVEGININPGATVDISSGRKLNLTNNLQISGFVIGQGVLELNGSVPQTITAVSPSSIQNLRMNNAAGASLSGPLSFIGNLKLSAGTLNTGGNLTMISNAAGTARIAPIEVGSDVVGDVVWQRYVPGPAGWRFIGTPIQNQNIGQWSDNFLINSNNFFIHNEAGILNVAPQTNGWQRSSTGGQVGKGYRVYFSSLPRMYDNRGPITKGLIPFSFPVSFTPTGYAGGGWNFLANPFPCEVNWLNFTRSPEIGESVYIFNKTSYGSYSAGSMIGTNGVTNVIAQGQGFFIKASAAGTLSANEQTKFENPQAHNFLRTVSNDYPVLKFYLQNIAQQPESDEMAVSFRDDATDGYDSRFDAHKFDASLSLSAWAGGNVHLSIQCLPLTSTRTTVIPLRINVPQAGTYTINMVHERGDENYRLWLKDNVNNTLEPVIAGQLMYLQLTEGVHADRFELVAQPLEVVTSNLKNLESNVMVYPNPATDKVTVGSSTEFSEISLINLQGRVLAVWPGQTGKLTRELSVGGFAKGIYIMSIKLNNGHKFEQKLSIH